MSNYTKGRWTIGVSQNGIFQVHVLEPLEKPNSFVLVEQICSIGYFLDVTDKHKANARLIAAAPELLQMIERLCNKIINGHPITLLDHDNMGLLIARATGTTIEDLADGEPFGVKNNSNEL